jgi:hypothetical protein
VRITPYEGADDGLWGRSEFLTWVRNKARSRMVSPDALLGHMRCRIAVDLHPEIQLPAIIGEHAALNLAACVTGNSGAGQSAPAAVAAGSFPWKTTNTNLGSGQGLVEVYGEMVKIKNADNIEGIADLGEYELKMPTNRALLHVEEIDKVIVDNDYRAANIRTGYVYVISNVGSVGPGVMKPPPSSTPKAVAPGRKTPTPGQAEQGRGVNVLQSWHYPSKDQSIPGLRGWRGEPVTTDRPLVLPTSDPTQPLTDLSKNGRLSASVGSHGQ